uniref:Uncharacterized protein n=1 Tax=Vespula pensylvanica TaxID=30213 RepID=A0A834UD85_VESPE|nr:hypothetical protein H0235_004807 [Vespula pensylvanica]
MFGGGVGVGVGVGVGEGEGRVPSPSVITLVELEFDRFLDILHSPFLSISTRPSYFPSFLFPECFRALFFVGDEGREPSKVAEAKDIVVVVVLVSAYDVKETKCELGCTFVVPVTMSSTAYIPW